MNAEEVDQVNNRLFHINTDIRKSVEFLRDAKQNISDAVDYFRVRRSDSILSYEEAISIIDTVLNQMDHHRSTLEKSSDKMIKMQVAIADRVKPLKLD